MTTNWYYLEDWIDWFSWKVGKELSLLAV